MKHIPKDYTPKLDFFETQKAIKFAKDTFEDELAKSLSLQRVSAPRFIKTDKGLQDDLAGTQTPVSFKTKFSEKIEVVHSLAKWKRYMLGKYKFKTGTGLYTDMDAIRKDEDISPIHSVYVDQWDWEKVISKEERTIDYIKKTVKEIYKALLKTESKIEKKFPKLKTRLPRKVHFIHAEELEEMYQDLSSKEREDEICKKHGAVFIIGIGHPLRSGKPHDLRAADYDDWSTETKKGKGLNGDLIVWDDTRKKSLELSSMGIRVDSKAMKFQLKHSGLDHLKELEFHKGVIEEKLPLTIGGGIGQSRICLFLLQKAHLGEVHSSVWPEEIEKEFKEKEIPLL